MLASPVEPKGWDIRWTSYILWPVSINAGVWDTVTGQGVALHDLDGAQTPVSKAGQESQVSINGKIRTSVSIRLLGLLILAVLGSLLS